MPAATFGARRRRGPLTALAWAALGLLLGVGELAELGAAETPATVERETGDPVADPTTDPPLARGSGSAAKAPTGAARPRRELPRPFANVRRFATPLIMPRLRLPKGLMPEFRVLEGLLTRARPNEPVKVTLTAYCLKGTTRRGLPVRPGIVAADPRLFPLARHVELYAAGRYLGRFLVDDTGAKVRGPHIDIWTPDCSDAVAFGTRSGVASLVAYGVR